MKAESYPLIIQVLHGYLMVYSPDFDYRVAEKYDPNLPGQSELMILKMRREILSLMKRKATRNEEVPSPSSPMRLFEDLDPDTLSVSEAARLLRISAATIRRMAETGRIKSRKTPGGHRRFARKDVLAHLVVATSALTPDPSTP